MPSLHILQTAASKVVSQLSTDANTTKQHTYCDQNSSMGLQGKLFKSSELNFRLSQCALTNYITSDTFIIANLD